MRMHSLKRPAFMYAKEFKLDKVLGNLQGYKIATGQLRKEELKNVSMRYGSDEGAVFGSLITNASCQSNQETRYECTNRPPTKKRRKRRKVTKATACSGTDRKPKPGVHPASSVEPLSIPAALLAHGDSSSDNESDADNGDYNTEDGKSSPSIESENSSTDSEDAYVDFFGLNESKPVKSSKTHGYSSSIKTYLPYQQRSQPAHQPNLTEKDPQIWDPVNLKYKERISTLSTYKCWKCRRVGHLPEDCTVNVKSSIASASNHGNLRAGLQSQQGEKRPFYSSNLKDYYKKSQELRVSKNTACNECGARSNLAYCFECGLVLCDGRGHLINHLLEHPSHTKLYSYKLQRQIKCCKSTCEVLDATELLMCSSCLDKAFTSHYSMINATWSKTGLKAIPNSLACEQHFHWHRMNCPNPSGEFLVTREKLENYQGKDEELLSEFFF